MNRPTPLNCKSIPVGECLLKMHEFEQVKHHYQNVARRETTGY